jgi:hypothetical protein
MNLVQRREAQTVRLAIAEKEFAVMLLKLLQECARGRSGLFGQLEKTYGAEKAAQYFSWPEADKLILLAGELAALRDELGDDTDFPALRKFLAYRKLSGPGVPSEPKLALQFLQELKREELADRTPPPSAFERDLV